MEGPDTKRLSEAIKELETNLKTYEEMRADYLEIQAQAEEMMRRAATQHTAVNQAWFAFFEAEKRFRTISDEYKGVELS